MCTLRSLFFPRARAKSPCPATRASFRLSALLLKKTSGSHCTLPQALSYCVFLLHFVIAVASALSGQIILFLVPTSHLGWGQGFLSLAWILQLTAYLVPVAAVSYHQYTGQCLLSWNVDQMPTRATGSISKIPMWSKSSQKSAAALDTGALAGLTFLVWVKQSVPSRMH